MSKTIFEGDEVYLSNESLRETYLASDKADLVYNLLRELENNGVDSQFKNSNEIESALKRFKNELHKFVR